MGSEMCIRDREMVSILAEDFPKLEVITGDVLVTAKEYVADLGEYKVVANIPYQITTPILKLFMEGEVGNRPLSLTLLVQKEVGERLTAKEKKPGRGYLSVLTQYFAEVHYLLTVPAESFWPAPEVDSAIIHLQIYPKRMVPIDQEKEFLRFVRTLFIHPRKQLKNVIAGIKGLHHTEVSPILIQLGLPDTVRAQELQVAQWVALFRASFDPKTS